MKLSRKYIKDIIITLSVLLGAFGLSLLFEYIFDVHEHITTVFIFGIFLISLLTEGYFYGVLADHLVNVGYSIVNPVGDEEEK